MFTYLNFVFELHLLTDIHSSLIFTLWLFWSSFCRLWWSSSLDYTRVWLQLYLLQNHPWFNSSNSIYASSTTTNMQSPKKKTTTNMGSSGILNRASLHLLLLNCYINLHFIARLHNRLRPKLKPFCKVNLKSPLSSRTYLNFKTIVYTV